MLLNSAQVIIVVEYKQQKDQEIDIIEWLTGVCVCKLSLQYNYLVYKICNNYFVTAKKK